MRDSDQMRMWPVGVAENLPAVPWTREEVEAAADEGPLIDPLAGLASLGFLKRELGRRRKLWLTLTAIGLIIGCGLFVALPAPYQAATTILLVDGPNQNPQYQIFSDEALAGSTAVALAAISQLHLDETPAALLGSISVTAPSLSALTITASAKTSAEAVRLATGMASAFLKVRSQYAQVHEQELETGLNQQLSAAEQKYAAANSALSTATANGTSGAALTAVKQQQQEAAATVSQDQQDVPGSVLSYRTATKSEVQDTQVIDVAIPLKHSPKKSMLYLFGAAVGGGLILGVGIVVVSALVSDKLRRRDDIAQTVGAPVGLSVGVLRPSRLPSLGRQAKNIERDMHRVVDYLSSLPSFGQTPATLGVVTLDDLGTAAQIVAGLAMACAQRGARILLADLSDRRHLARLLDSAEPGVRQVSSGDAHFMLVVPEPDGMAPTGPLPSRKTSAGAAPQQAVLAAVRSCDMVITLATLDPAQGGDYLGTWASDAVVLVTAGKSAAGRIRAVGELVRLSGTRLRAVVLIGADKTDDSLGVVGLAGTGMGR